MSLMEFCGIEYGKVVPKYTNLLKTIPCDWCDFPPVDPVIQVGALWVCPACYEEGALMWSPSRERL